ncbi:MULTISPECIES: hypothetical protein [Lactococcus]|uniref:hypothetical protein n=1 Tax=Lactococcus TaxID=1357 RepID=UPI0013FDCC48|nr:hypothetical protein [Lactococcus garvieae]
MSVDNFVKIWLPIISIIFTVINCGITVFNVKRDSKKYRSSLRTVYVEKIFDDYLVERLPKLRNKIAPTENGFDGLIQLAEEVAAMRKDILYFRYNSEKFYNKLDETLRNFEDFLSDNIGKKMDIQGDQAKFHNKVNEYLSSIYSQVDKHYSGK